MAAKEYDVIVIGAGSTGENVADRAVKGGLRTVVVEADLVGGECSYWACVPSKALLRPIQALTTAQSVAGARQAVTGRLDVAQIFARRDSFTAHWNDKGQTDWLHSAKIDLVRGRARLDGERKVIVTEKNGSTIDLTARHAVTDIGFGKVSKHWLCLDTFSIHPCAVVTFHEPVPRRIEWLGKLVHEPLCGS